MANYILVINSYGMGSAAAELSELLAANYLKLLADETQLPSSILFYAEGVKLCSHNSYAKESLQKLESRGVKLLACTTCLNFYNIKDELAVGTACTMADIQMYQIHADKVITL